MSLNVTVNDAFSLVWGQAIDLTNTFIIPVTCFYGVITNIINIFVFLNKELKDITFKYYLVNAFSNLVYLTICFFFFAPKCGIYCDLKTNLATQIYLWFFYRYFKGIFACLTICIQITVSLYRYFIVINKNTDTFKRIRLLIFLFTLCSAIFYTPHFFTQQVNIIETNTTSKIKNVTVYSISFKYTQTISEIGKTDIGKWLVIIASIIRGFIALFIMGFIDILMLVKIRSHLQHVKLAKANKIPNESRETSNQTVSSQMSSSTKKHNVINNDINANHKITNLDLEEIKRNKEEKLNRNLTYMVVTIDVLFMIGNIPNSIVFVFSQYVNTSGLFYLTISGVSNLILFASAGSDLLIYYSFNRLYRKKFKKLFCFLKP